MDLGIKGKKAIMAGGSAGMGRATAERLAEAGVELVITARREERLLNAAREMSEKYGVSVTPVVADSSKEEGRPCSRPVPTPISLRSLSSPRHPTATFSR
jgi:3-oxoacyl-[acyl-carrier protein] reductase